MRAFANTDVSNRTLATTTAVATLAATPIAGHDANGPQRCISARDALRGSPSHTASLGRYRGARLHLLVRWPPSYGTLSGTVPAQEGHDRL